MDLDNELTDETAVQEIGRRLARRRLQRNLTQQQLAEEAGVERKAVARLEAGEPVQLMTFIRALRALGLLGTFQDLLPKPEATPIELLETQGRERQRASGARRRRTTEAQAPWRWGDRS